MSNDGFDFETEPDVDITAGPAQGDDLRDVFDLPPLGESATVTTTPDVAEGFGLSMSRYELPVASAVPEANLPALDIQALLTFLPDVALKRDLDAVAAAAQALLITGEDGLAAADALLPDLKGRIAHIEQCFKEPCAVANTLHKRLTGLRAVFVETGEAAIKRLSDGIIAEKRRLDAIVEQERRLAQAEADRLAREAMAAAAKKAEMAQAAPAVVEQLKAQAVTATAPPVAARSSGSLRSSAVAEKWTVRLKGSDGQPAMADLTEAQRLVAIELVRAVADGKAPLACLEINWPYLRKRAGADKKVFSIPGIEAYDEGSVRAKGRK